MFKHTIIFLLFTVTTVFPQEILTLQDAVRIGLENNFSIKIARNEAQIAANNATLGNSGFLPRIDASGARTFSVNDSRQQRADGRVEDKKGANSNSTTAGVSLNWTIFDGLNMFISYARYKEFSAVGLINAKAGTEDRIASIMSAYYNIVSIEQSINAIKNAIGISEERVRIAEDKLSIGSGSKLELLQAKVDLNADRSSLLRQQQNLSNAKISLNQLLGRNPSTEYIVKDTIVMEQKINREDITPNVRENNTELLTAERNRNIAALNLRGIKSQWFPKINAFVNYNYSKSTSEAGLLLVNESRGFNYGLNFSFPLFEGFNTRRQIENARISLINSELQLSDITNRVEANLEQQFSNYSTGLEILQMEEENYDVARQNAAIALERFRLGSYSAIELREAQRAFLDAQSRLVSAQFNAKNSEIELLRLSGSLIK